MQVQEKEMITRREFCFYLGALSVVRVQLASAESSPERLYAYVTCGDNQWNLDSLPIDSPATVEAIFEFLAKTFHIERVYWRGEQDRMWQEYVHFRPENALYYDHFVNWLHYLNMELKLNDIAVAAAH